LLDALDGKLSRLGAIGASLLLTAAAVTTVVTTHFLIRHLQDAPVRAMSVVQLAVEMTVVIFPMILYARRVIAELNRSRTKLSMLGRRLEVAAEQAHQANRAKSQFLANMSHELRTPLNAIIGFSSIMQKGMFGDLNPKYAEYAGMVCDSGTHLLAIINDILDLARAESNKLELREEDIDIARVIALSSTIVREMADKAGVDYDVTMVDVLPRVRADSAKLRQILINLLGNAVKFTPSGGKVSLSAEATPDGGLVFRIADTGIGIPADKMDVAMAPFGQVDSRLARKYEGTGLGLPLTKRLVEMHGGTFDLASEPGRGTVATVRLPKIPGPALKMAV